MSNLMSNYSPLEVTFVKGEGCWLTDSNGDEYLDALSGIGVVNLGHCHPTVTKNLVNQSQKLLHTSNVYRIDNQEKLAKKLDQSRQGQQTDHSESNQNKTKCTSQANSHARDLLM